MHCCSHLRRTVFSNRLAAASERLRMYCSQVQVLLVPASSLQLPYRASSRSRFEIPQSPDQILRSKTSQKQSRLWSSSSSQNVRAMANSSAAESSGRERTALITGVASKSGIGQGLVRAFLDKGYRVFGTDVRPLEASESLLSQAAGPSERTGGQDSGAFGFAKADISKPEEVKSMVEEAARFLGGRIHVVINNAGRADPFIPEGSDVIREFSSFVNTNLVGAFNVTACALEHMPAGKSSVIYISSTRALQSEPHSEGYAAAKAGMLGLTHAQAITLAGKVRVNAVLPGWIDTSPRKNASEHSPDLSKEDHEWQPVGRVGLPTDVAHMCIFLSDQSLAGFITGQQFVVDGGVTKKMVYPE